MTGPLLDSAFLFFPEMGEGRGGGMELEAFSFTWTIQLKNETEEELILTNVHVSFGMEIIW